MLLWCIDFLESAFIITEAVEVFIDMLPFVVLLVYLHLEVGEKISLHL